jgi:hypothetical protein
MSRNLGQMSDLFLFAAIGDSDEEGEEMLESLLAYQYLRYKSDKPQSILKSAHWIDRILFHYDDARFKKSLRMARPLFFELLSAIQSHSSFVPLGTKRQVPVRIQLAVFLMRLGSKETNLELSNRCGLSDGVIVAILRRVSFVLCETLKSQYVKWPDGPAKTRIKAAFLEQYGLPDVIGVLDGSHFPLLEAPRKDPETYFTRKKRYAVHGQATCDDTGTITSFEIGWPGSVHDSKVFHASPLFLQRSRLFQGEEYLLADSGYALYPFVMTPYRCTESALHRQFNSIHSSARVRIEHCFGLLKMRWAFLREIRTRDMHLTTRMIECAFILHNFCQRRSDPWEEEMGAFGAGPEDQPHDDPPASFRATLAPAKARRNYLASLLAQQN